MAKKAQPTMTGESTKLSLCLPLRGLGLRLGALLLALPLAAIPAQADEPPPIKVGVVFSFTGPSPLGGAELDTAFRVFMDEHGDKIAGRKVELIRRDDTGPAPDVVKRLVQELIVQDKVDILAGISYTPNALAAGGVTTAAKKPLFIVNAATSGILAKAPYLVRFGFTTPQITVPLAQWAAKNGAKSVYVLYSDYGPGVDAGAAFTKTFTAAGGTIAGEVRAPLRNPDFSAYVQRIKDANPDSVFVFLPAGDQPGIFLKAFTDAGLGAAGIKILATGDLTEESSLDTMGDAALGIVTAYHYSDVHDSDLNHAFVKKFEAASGNKLRPDFVGAVAYDVLGAVYHVIEAQGGNVDPDKTMALIKGYKAESPRGPIMIDPETRDIVQNVYIRRVERRDGHLVNAEIATIPMVKDPNE
jgi:branched-chain amino acid transport system substrate-binding protein